MTTAIPTKEIVYSREDRDYKMLLDGECIGFARTYHQAEVTLDQVMYELLAHSDPGGPEPPGDDIPGPGDPLPPAVRS